MRLIILITTLALICAQVATLDEEDQLERIENRFGDGREDMYNDVQLKTYENQGYNEKNNQFTKNAHNNFKSRRHNIQNPKSVYHGFDAKDSKLKFRDYNQKSERSLTNSYMPAKKSRQLQDMPSSVGHHQESYNAHETENRYNRSIDQHAQELLNKLIDNHWNNEQSNDIIDGDESDGFSFRNLMPFWRPFDSLRKENRVPMKSIENTKTSSSKAYEKLEQKHNEQNNDLGVLKDNFLLLPDQTKFILIKALENGKKSGKNRFDNLAHDEEGVKIIKLGGKSDLKLEIMDEEERKKILSSMGACDTGKGEEKTNTTTSTEESQSRKQSSGTNQKELKGDKKQNGLDSNEYQKQTKGDEERKGQERHGSQQKQSKESTGPEGGNGTNKSQQQSKEDKNKKFGEKNKQPKDDEEQKEQETRWVNQQTKGAKGHKSHESEAKEQTDNPWSLKKFKVKEDPKAQVAKSNNKEEKQNGHKSSGNGGNGRNGNGKYSGQKSNGHGRKLKKPGKEEEQGSENGEHFTYELTCVTYANISTTTEAGASKSGSEKKGSAEAASTKGYPKDEDFTECNPAKDSKTEGTTTTECDSSSDNPTKTKSHSSKPPTGNSRPSQESTTAISKPRDKGQNSSKVDTDTLEKDLKEEILNCTAEKLEKYLKSLKEKDGKDDQRINGKTTTTVQPKLPERKLHTIQDTFIPTAKLVSLNRNLEFENMLGHLSRADLLRLNITINGLVMKDSRPSQIHGNATINLLPAKRPDERWRRGIKNPFSKKDKTQDDEEKECEDDKENDGDDNNKENDKRESGDKKSKSKTPDTEFSKDAMSSYQISNEIVKLVSQMVHSNPNMKTLWPSLKRNKPGDQAKTAATIRKLCKGPGRRRLEEMIRRAMSSVDEIIEQEVQQRSCAPLSEDLHNFYEMILSLHAKQAKRTEERDGRLHKSETLDDDCGAKDAPSEPCDKNDETSLNDNSLYDMIHERRLKYDQEMSAIRHSREALQRNHDLEANSANSALVRKLREGYSPAFLKLHEVADAIDRATVEGGDAT